MWNFDKYALFYPKTNFWAGEFDPSFYIKRSLLIAPPQFFVTVTFYTVLKLSKSTTLF